MEYVLTEHARDALEKRRIQTAWLEQVLNAPKVTEADPGTRTWNIASHASASSAGVCCG